MARARQGHKGTQHTGVYVCMYVCIYTCTCICIYIHIHTSEHTYIYIYIYICIYSRPPRSTPKAFQNLLTPYIYIYIYILINYCLYMQMQKTLQIPMIFVLKRLFLTSCSQRCVHADARHGLPGSDGSFWCYRLRS